MAQQEQHDQYITPNANGHIRLNQSNDIKLKRKNVRERERERENENVSMPMDQCNGDTN